VLLPGTKIFTRGKQHSPYGGASKINTRKKYIFFMETKVYSGKIKQGGLRKLDCFRYSEEKMVSLRAFPSFFVTFMTKNT
jgi:hypothetical protein